MDGATSPLGVHECLCSKDFKLGARRPRDSEAARMITWAALSTGAAENAAAMDIDIVKGAGGGNGRTNREGRGWRPRRTSVKYYRIDIISSSSHFNFNSEKSRNWR